ncbi:MAG TPA: spore coat protein [Ruminococcaceae bacterium]|nr:spore coat protein [Oscillospiraceae bacterium]
MNDKHLMENILLLEKGVCDLFLHGTIESSTDNVHQTFNSALNNALTMQDTIYDKMAAKGWYPTEQVEQNKVTSVKMKFGSQAQ